MNEQNDKQSGVVFAVKKYALHDGPGIRTTVFLKGCPLSCWWCQNPESQEPEPQPVSEGNSFSSFGRDGKIGKRRTADAVINEVLKDRIFYDESGGGVTFSGGEPLMQPDFLLSLLKLAGEKGLHRTVDTSGYAPSAILKSIIPHTELFLYDLKIIDDALHRKYTGVSSEPILHNLNYLACTKVKVCVRFPVVPGMTDSMENLQDTARFLSSLPGMQDIALLPYNRLGDYKNDRLGLKNRMQGIDAPSKKTMAELQDFFTDKGFNCIIGG